MPVTQLSLTAIPGARYSFIAKAPAGIGGPYSWEAGEVFQAGAVVGEVFQPGQSKGETFQAGTSTGEVI